MDEGERDGEQGAEDREWFIVGNSRALGWFIELFLCMMGDCEERVAPVDSYRTRERWIVDSL